MEICKTEATQAGLGIFWHILTNSGTRRHIQEVFGHIQAYLQPFVTPAYLEPWYIQNQNPGILLRYSNKLAYFELIAVLVYGSCPLISHEHLWKICANDFLYRASDFVKK